jgi:hypothetical protein
MAPNVAMNLSFGEGVGWKSALLVGAAGAGSRGARWDALKLAPTFEATFAPAAAAVGGREITTRREMQEASQPKAEAAEPTSVTGTRSASPRKRAASVAAPMIRMALLGVWKRG